LDTGRLRRDERIASAGPYDVSCDATVIRLEGVDNGTEVRSSHGMTKAASVTLTNANRKSTGCERIGSIFVASLLLM
jgi:hypothetical protein